MGRALGNNLINLTAYKEVQEALEEIGLDINVIWFLLFIAANLLFCDTQGYFFPIDIPFFCVEIGLDINVIEDQEPDPALGNGGLLRSSNGYPSFSQLSGVST